MPAESTAADAVAATATDPDDLRHRLTAARAALQRTQREMAAALKTPYATYRQWERGERRTPGVAVVAAELLCGCDSAATERYLRHWAGRMSHADISAALGRDIKGGGRWRRERLLCLADGSRTMGEIAAEIGVAETTARKMATLLRREGHTLKVRHRVGPPRHRASSLRDWCAVDETLVSIGLSRRAAARMLGISYPTLGKWAAIGYVPDTPSGRAFLRALDEMATTQTEEAPQ